MKPLQKTKYEECYEKCLTETWSNQKLYQGSKNKKGEMSQNDNKSKMKLRESVQIRVVFGTKLKSKLRSLQEPFNIDLLNLSDLTNYVWW